MSEISKCPICGSAPVKMVFGAGWAKDGYKCCGHSVDTIIQWNQYAAAMEFTRWVAGQHYANGLSKAMIIQKAKEVFNE